MIANLILKQKDYYCSNCMMRQSQIQPQCFFCGNWFSNYEDILLECFKEKERKENENNVCRRN